MSEPNDEADNREHGGENSGAQIIRLQERLRFLETRIETRIGLLETRVIDELDRSQKQQLLVMSKLSEFDKLATQGKMAVVVLITLGGIVGWILATWDKVKSIAS